MIEKYIVLSYVDVAFFVVKIDTFKQECKTLLLAAIHYITLFERGGGNS